MYENKDIQGVVVATPDHWHALLTIMACAAGKDVYVEKPMTLFIDEGKWMIQAARKYNRIVTVGTQRRQGKGVAAAKKVVESGHAGQDPLGPHRLVTATFIRASARPRFPIRRRDSTTTCGWGRRPRSPTRRTAASTISAGSGIIRAAR